MSGGLFSSWRVRLGVYWIKTAEIVGIAAVQRPITIHRQKDILTRIFDLLGTVDMDKFCDDAKNSIKTED